MDFATYVFFLYLKLTHLFLTLDVYLSFPGEIIYVDEGDGMVNICLELSGVSEPTEAAIWANIYSQDDSATGRV